MNEHANGNGLPTDRQAAVEYGLVQFQTMMAERDQMARDYAELRTKYAGLEVACEAQTAQITDMQSRVATASLVRDQAVADRAKYETLFISIQAQLRAFAIPAAPLVTGSED